jgi:hypothetical protein
MRKVAIWGLSLLLIGALAKPALAQQPKLPTTEIYNAYMAAYDEKDPVKKAANAEKFITTYKDIKDTDPLAIERMYMMALGSYWNAKNFAKAIETADKQAAIAPGLSADDKKTVLQYGMESSGQAGNKAKLKEYSEKILVGDPKDLKALVNLSNLLGDMSTLPADDAGKQKRFDETLTITRRALDIPMPAGLQAAQWNTVVLPLRHTECLVLLNQKKNSDAIESCKKAIALDKNDSYAYYLTGLAKLPELIAANNKYQEAVKNYNDNRDKGPLVTDELKSVSDGMFTAAQNKKDEVIDAFARSVAAGGNGAADAKKQLANLFTGTAAELDQLIAEKKNALTGN